MFHFNSIGNIFIFGRILKSGMFTTEENSKNKNIREMYKGINEFMKGYQPHTYVIKTDDGTIVADTASISSRWEQFFGNLLNVNQSSSPEGSEIYTVEPDIPEPSLVEVELVTENLKKHTAPGVDNIHPN